MASTTYTTEYINTLELDEEELSVLCQQIEAGNRSILQDPEVKLWLIIDGLVLNMQSFITKHPGGHHAILQFVGHDASKNFHDIHSNRTRLQLNNFVIGRIQD